MSMGHGTRECKSKRAIETETVRRSCRWLRASHILTDELADARNGLLRFREDEHKMRPHMRHALSSFQVDRDARRQGA